jgi:hypothetical protein
VLYPGDPMNYINISHSRRHSGSISGRSSEIEDRFPASSILEENGFWSTQLRDSPISEHVIIDYGEEVYIDYIEIFPVTEQPSGFPPYFHLECSDDSSVWRILLTEKEYKTDGNPYRVDLPLTRTRFLKFAAPRSCEVEGKYQVRVARIEAGISGVMDLEATSSEHEHDVMNLLSANNRETWLSSPNSNPTRETINIDLGAVYGVNRIIMESSLKGFPANITIETSAGEDVWTILHDEKGFLAESFKKYYWEEGVVQARFIRIEMSTTPFFENRHQVQLASVEICAAVQEGDHSHNIGDLTSHASVFMPGMVRLARDGEDTMGTAVQANDRRLRDASELFKGIVRFAEEGESEPLVALQSSDRRVQPATGEQYGIVRLAFDREIKPGSVVQGSDSRLQHATTDNFGIVRLCPDGEYMESGVITGNDRRLQKATTDEPGISRIAKNGESSHDAVVSSTDRRLSHAGTTSYGIAILAGDGEVAEGKAVQANDRRLREATTLAPGIVELAVDGEEKDGTAVQGSDRRLRDATTESKGIVELAEDGEEKDGTAVQGSDRRLRDATTESKGIVELAENGEKKAGVVVQGNDRRLEDASTVSTGIVRLASDGEETEGAVVQGNDRRLREATTVSGGIVRLASDGETAEGAVVQGNDRRLRDATTESKGIVELAEDGEDKPDTAVQGNDRRLREATTVSTGIVRLASDGETADGAAVQGSDSRLRDATTESKGIVELAGDGEDAPGTVVQGNDRRLRDATTTTKGIIELAEDGEDTPGTAVQGNDSRLRIGTEEYPGILRMASPGEAREGLVVQSRDPRLSDPREPLPHEHEYAPLHHRLEDHEGTLSVDDNRAQKFTDVNPPLSDSSVIFGKNNSGETGAVGITGTVRPANGKKSPAYGVVGDSLHMGVRGQATGESDSPGCGIAGLARNGYGGAFMSEHGYSLMVDGFGRETGSLDETINLKGDGKALFVDGESVFNGPASFQHTGGDATGNLVEYFEVDDEEYISPGDMLVVSEKGKSMLSKSRVTYNRSVIGVVSDTPVIVLNKTRKGKIYAVALAGRVMCKVDARNRPIRPGDLIVTSDTPGCGMSGKIDSFDKIGTVLGKALDGLEEGLGTIPLFIQPM